MSRLISRRNLLRAGVASAGSALLAGCDIYEGPSFEPILDFGQMLSYRTHRLILAAQPLGGLGLDAHARFPTFRATYSPS